MMETLNMALIRFPVGFFEEIIAVFKIKKISNSHRKRQKLPNFSIFQSFYKFFVKFLTQSVNWKILKGQQGKSWLSSKLVEKIIAFFKMKMSQIDTKNNKFSTIFKDFRHFFQVFDGLCKSEH